MMDLARIEFTPLNLLNFLNSVLHFFFYTASFALFYSELFYSNSIYENENFFYQSKIMRMFKYNHT